MTQQQTEPNLVERMKNTVLSYPVVAVVVFIAIVIIALGTFTPMP